MIHVTYYILCISVLVKQPLDNYFMFNCIAHYCYLLHILFSAVKSLLILFFCEEISTQVTRSFELSSKCPRFRTAFSVFWGFLRKRRPTWKRGLLNTVSATFYESFIRSTLKTFKISLSTLYYRKVFCLKPCGELVQFFYSFLSVIPDWLHMTESF